MLSVIAVIVAVIVVVLLLVEEADVMSTLRRWRQASRPTGSLRLRVPDLAREEWQEEATRPALIELNLEQVATAADLQLLLSTGLRFPGYYGNNWDAFWDCIRDDDQSVLPSTLRLRGWAALEARLPRDAHFLRQCLDDLRNERSDVTVEWA